MVSEVENLLFAMGILVANDPLPVAIKLFLMGFCHKLAKTVV